MSTSKYLKVVDYADDGRPVIGGLFPTHDTEGVPLSVSLTFIEKHGMVPDLFGFIGDAALAGWKRKSILIRVREAVIDVHGPHHWAKVEERLNSTCDLLKLP